MKMKRRQTKNINSISLKNYAEEPKTIANNLIIKNN